MTGRRHRRHRRHIDHGKTSLVRALTGIDCDRWEQEKARGITIDLGFAHLESEGLQIGFVDVPGHERFLHNALAGLGGIRILLLVVAADEGVKPQTREHLDICSLLEIPQAVVALTKSDLAAPDLLELAQLELEELLAEGPFAGAPILPVSSHTGDGLDELKKALLDAAAAQALEGEPTEEPARLPIDRAFLLKGVGVVVTGTLTSGVIRAGDTLEVHGTAETARVRGVQVHGEARDKALAGERTSLQLTGIEIESLARGLSLTTPGPSARSAICAAAFAFSRTPPRPCAAPCGARPPLRLGSGWQAAPWAVRSWSPAPPAWWKCASTGRCWRCAATTSFFGAPPRRPRWGAARSWTRPGSAPGARPSAKP